MNAPRGALHRADLFRARHAKASCDALIVLCQERLGILAFLGNPRGGGDETQVPILIRPDSNAPIKVRWKWWEP